jgi:hypothetical protein
MSRPRTLGIIGLDGGIQIRSNDCEGVLHVVDHVAPARIDIADQNSPTIVSATFGGFTPEAQNENLIRCWTL